MLYWRRVTRYRYCMRRVLVIFLILLYPLNVLALSTALVQHGHATERAFVQPAQPGESPGADLDAGLAADLSTALDCDAGCDIDPDEPPPGADLHSIFGRTHCLRPAGLWGIAAPPHDAALQRRAVPPPVKPPRLA